MNDEAVTEDGYLTTVERVIPAPPERIFDLLADPSRHREIDGSGSVRDAKTGSQRLALGSTFTMAMKMGIPYSTVSDVVEYEENRRIAWQTYSTITWLKRFGGGRVWRYELERVDGGTLVRETWDTTHEAPSARRNLVKTRTRDYMIASMEKTLLRIEQIAAANGRPEGMSDVEWLVALEEIRQLKARRDRYADAHDWEGYESLHAPDHVSHNDGQAPWTSSKEMIENVRRIMGDMITIHHSYDPDIVFDSPTSARGIWAMTGGIVAHGDDGDTWSIGYGYYHESYEKRDGRWLFTSRRWHRYFAIGPDGVTFPDESPKGADAFDDTGFGTPAPPAD